MANNRRPGGGAGKGFKSFLATATMIVLIAAGIMGWMRVNNISGVEGIYDYFKSVSDKTDECLNNEDSDCAVKVPVPSGNSTPKSGSGSSDSKDKDNVSDKDDKAAKDKTPAEVRSEALEALKKIKVAEPQEVAYSRSEWKHWIGSPCNTRETVLKKQGSKVKADDKTCKILSGSWVDPYSGSTFTDAGKLDIDHVIPLGYAAKHGGNSWSAAKKQEFANDTSQLLAVSASENRSKSDKGPSKYMPPNKSFQCQYAKTWISTASKYGLTLAKADTVSLTAAIQKCS